MRSHLARHCACFELVLGDLGYIWPKLGLKDDFRAGKRSKNAILGPKWPKIDFSNCLAIAQRRRRAAPQARSAAGAQRKRVLHHLEGLASVLHHPKRPEARNQKWKNPQKVVR